MHKLYSFLLIIFFIFSLIASSCSTDFDVNEEWKEISIIYGLLNRNDSVQYFKINKAFLNDERSALQIARTADSIYHDTILVKLQEIKNGQIVSETSLQKIYNENKEPGNFAYPGQFLYRTPPGYKIDPSSNYKIVAINPLTAYEANATTTIADNATLYRHSQIGRGIFRPMPLILETINWTTGKNVRFYDYYFDIYYTETNIITGETLIKKAQWPISRYTLTPNLSGGSEMKFDLIGEEFYKIIFAQVLEDKNVKRKLLYADFVLEAAGAELYNYISIHRPSTGIVQKRPDYTNINNGYGLFSSRTFQKFSLEISGNITTELKNHPLTKQLNFE